jgi:lipopolysaccharide export system protein LptA
VIPTGFAMKILTSFFTLLILLSTSFVMHAQKTRIRILHANSLEYDHTIGKDVQRLKGEVRFENKGAILDCDSAYFYPNNSIDAFGNIRVNQGDSLFLNSDFLHMDAEKKQTLVSGNVRLQEGMMTLNAPSLIYNSTDQIAYYAQGGTIINGKNTLTSKKGYYYTAIKMLAFKDSVRLHNPSYDMYADTLLFNTVSEIAYFRGPTTIQTDNSLMYTEKGWYNTQTDYTELTLNNWFQGENQYLEADSILYNRFEQIGRAYNHVVIEDTTNQLVVRGDVGFYNQKTNWSYVTQKANMVQAFNTDSLFLAADTLEMYHDTITKMNDIYGYYNVRYFKSDIQGVCDSLTYKQIDSLIEMHSNPVLWSENNQLSGAYMEIELDSGSVDQLNIYDEAYIISRVDSSGFYNQIKGRDMKAYFIANELDHIYVDGNGQTLYFAQDEEGGNFIGMNKADCSNILVRVKDSQIHKIIFLEQPLGSLIPMSKLDLNVIYLEDFILYNDVRPKNRLDIFPLDSIELPEQQ